MVKSGETGDCGLHEQRVYASNDFGAQRKVIANFVLIRGGSKEEDEL